MTLPTRWVLPQLHLGLVLAAVVAAAGCPATGGGNTASSSSSSSSSGTSSSTGGSSQAAPGSSSTGLVSSAAGSSVGTGSSSSSSGAGGGCAAATLLVPGTVNGTTQDHADNFHGCDGTPRAMGALAPDQVWRLTLTERKLARFTLNSSFDAALYVLEAPACAVDAPVLADTCTDRTYGAQETLVTYLDVGTYWVVVDGYRDDTAGTTSQGTYSLTLALEDPCAGQTPEGTCTTDGATWCINPPAGLRTVFTATSVCTASERCVTLAGRSRCMPIMDVGAPCEGSHNVCANASEMRVCVNNQWASTPCANGCRQTAVGALCVDPSPALTSYRGTLQYEYRRPRADLTDWASTVSVAPAQQLLLYSARITPQATTVFDATTTRKDGSYNILVPQTPTPDDVILLYAALPSFTNGNFRVAIAQPNAPDGTVAIDGFTGAQRAWSWALRPAVTPSNTTITIAQDNGSAALRVLDNMRVVYENTAGLYYRGIPAQSVVVWFRPNTSWSCGECLWRNPVNDVLGQTFNFQMFINGSPSDEQYWSDAVSFHEAGHWVMGNFGVSPGEGGSHCFGVAYPPGLAWSEGWATWLSSFWRDDPRYLDKQGGSMFWLDISSRTSDSTWPRPTAAAGLFQNIYENEVSAILWSLTVDPEVGGNPLFRALSSTRASQPLRGYHRKTWTVDGFCQPVEVMDTGQPTVMMADFLDALVCAGAPADVAARVDNATQPTVSYPYPSAAPVCQ